MKSLEEAQYKDFYCIKCGYHTDLNCENFDSLSRHSFYSHDFLKTRPDIDVPDYNMEIDCTNREDHD